MRDGVIGLAHVDHLERAASPAARALRLAVTSGPHASASRLGHGDTSTRGHAGPARALDGDVTRVPRGDAFLFERLVVLVDHDDHCEVGAPGPTPRCGRRS